MHTKTIKLWKYVLNKPYMISCFKNKKIFEPSFGFKFSSSSRAHVATEVNHLAYLKTEEALQSNEPTPLCRSSVFRCTRSLWLLYRWSQDHLWCFKVWQYETLRANSLIFLSSLFTGGRKKVVIRFQWNLVCTFGFIQAQTE